MQEKISAYIEWKKDHSPKTKDPYQRWLNRFNSFVEKRELRDINFQDITRFSNHIKGIYSQRTHEYCIAILHGFFKFWHGEDNAVLSPNKVVVPRYYPKKMPVTSEEIFQKLINEVPPDDFIGLQRHLIIRILWETGCRVSELLSIDISNINFEKKFATIETRKAFVHRRIFWSETTNELLLNKYLPLRSKAKTDSIALFVGSYKGGKYSERLNPRQVQRTIEHLRKKLDIPDRITPHSFRHGKAHQMLERGASVVDIQQILGHVSPNSSFAYLQYWGNELENRAMKFL
ncbi:MAG: tyrosine-type recombinase/integrase [Bacteroidetes bacterium]|nr:tyrosine-type recombinase/integrase [Bacteroidota bacterium]